MSIQKLKEVIQKSAVKRITHSIKSHPDLVEFL